jgi:hypothetical protein
VEERDEKTGSDPGIEISAIDEGPKEGDDVEGHKRFKLKATSEPGSDDSDDVEVHRKKTLK